MQNKQLKLKIITPLKLVLEEMVDQVSIPTTEGEITILAHHIPLVASLASGDVVACVNDECIPFAIVGGFVEIKTNEDGLTEVAVLADFAEHVSDISDEKIQKAKDEAEALRIKMQNTDDVDFEHFETELERSLTSVKIADKWRNRKYRR